MFWCYLVGADRPPKQAMPVARQENFRWKNWVCVSFGRSLCCYSPFHAVKKWHYMIRSVCVFSSHSFWTSSSLDVPAGVTQQEEGHTGFIIHLSAVRALIFLARGFSHSFPSSTVKSNFVY